MINDRIWTFCPFGRFACSVFHLKFHPNTYKHIHTWNHTNNTQFDQHWGDFWGVPGTTLSLLPCLKRWISQGLWISRGAEKVIGLKTFLWSRSLFDPRSIATYISRLQDRATCTPQQAATSDKRRKRQREVCHSTPGVLYSNSIAYS